MTEQSATTDVITLDPIKVTATAPSKNSTTISGNTDLDRCLRKASCLIFDVYERDNASLPESLQPLLAEAKNNWSKLFDNRNDRVGYRAVLYRPVGSDADKERGALCPPALVFRGSDFTEEEFSGFAVSIEIDYRWDWGVLSADASDEAPERFEYVFSPNPEVKKLTPAQLPNEGFSRTALFDQDAGHITLRGVTPMPLPRVPYVVNVAWSGSIAVWTRDKGDWATNFLQGVGGETTQYDELAVGDARNAAEIAISDWGGRLMILGHSLGGGLASQAACVAQKENPDLILGARTFNAAGLHTKTAKRAGTSLSAATVLSYAVEDEILTTLQKQNCPIPLVGSVFRWADRDLPDAVTSVFENLGPDMGKLWPVPASEFPMLTEAERIAIGCATLSEFATRYIQHIWRISAWITAWNLWGLYREVQTLNGRGAESVDRHSMGAVAATYKNRIGD